MLVARQSELKWDDSDILILTCEIKDLPSCSADEIDESDQEQQVQELCLWACTPDLNLTLLLKDTQENSLDTHSYFTFLKIHVRSQTNNQTSQNHQATQLCLVCTTGREERRLSFYALPGASQR